jgi:hypothetical protein
MICLNIISNKLYKVMMIVPVEIYIVSN